MVYSKLQLFSTKPCACYDEETSTSWTSQFRLLSDVLTLATEYCGWVRQKFVNSSAGGADSRRILAFADRRRSKRVNMKQKNRQPAINYSRNVPKKTCDKTRQYVSARSLLAGCSGCGDRRQSRKFDLVSIRFRVNEVFGQCAAYSSPYSSKSTEIVRRTKDSWETQHLRFVYMHTNRRVSTNYHATQKTCWYPLLLVHASSPYRRGSQTYNGRSLHTKSIDNPTIHVETMRKAQKGDEQQCEDTVRISAKRRM